MIRELLIILFFFLSGIPRLQAGAAGNSVSFSPEEAELKREINQAPTAAKGHENLGVYYFEQARYGEAMGQFQTVLSLEPSNIFARYRLGLCLEQQGQYREAIRNYSEAFRWTAYQVNFRLGVCHHYLFQDRKAIDFLRQVESVKSTPAAHYMLAQSWAGIANYREALTELEQGRLLDPQFEIGKIYFDTPEALEETQIEWQRQAQNKLFEILAGSLLFVFLIVFLAAGRLIRRRAPKWRAWEVKQVA